jgi:hypothetical protein
MHLSQLSSAHGRVQQLHCYSLKISICICHIGSSSKGICHSCRQKEASCPVRTSDAAILKSSISLILLQLMDGLLKGPLEPIIALNYLKIHILLNYF